MEPIKTQMALARIVGRSQPVVSIRLRDTDCPIPAKGPWTRQQAQQMAGWLGTLKADAADGYHPGAGPGPGTRHDLKDLHTPSQATRELRLIDARLKAERAMKIRLEREALQSQYLAKSKVIEGWVQRVAFFRKGLDGLATSLAPRLVGLGDVRQIAQIIQEANDVWLEEISRRPR